ncbi:biogenesis of lysosome-related organelles complex 1 subunit 1 [Cornus florida]|uniref:biogenesis of lysosome-related organelles complex 1 subunit 1 n=1 Tax=Cornus florida TaxID=4283 RepID=UPI00289AAA2D|nr:biogenesis of lysosome-related organelles complex 1 subunit 1 [Cornus florida]
MYSPQLPLAGRFSSSSSSSDSHAEFGRLEASLLQLINDHQYTSLKLRQHTEKAKKDAIRTAVRVSDLLMDAVNGGVQEAFINEKRIELEIRALASTIMRFAKQTDHWLAASHAINTAVKEIGDFENWMKTMEFDCKSINAAIRNIHQA